MNTFPCKVGRSIVVRTTKILKRRKYKIFCKVCWTDLIKLFLNYFYKGIIFHQVNEMALASASLHATLRLLQVLDHE
jgi:hypothetical protein